MGLAVLPDPGQGHGEEKPHSSPKETYLLVTGQPPLPPLIRVHVGAALPGATAPLQGEELAPSLLTILPSLT